MAGEGRSVWIVAQGMLLGKKVSVVAVRDFPYNVRLHQNKMF